MEQERKELLNNESEDRAKNKTGLVLEGGGMRGIYTAGVLDVFLDEGLEFDGVIGVSAGAMDAVSCPGSGGEVSGIIKNTVRTNAL